VRSVAKVDEVFVTTFGVLAKMPITATFVNRNEISSAIDMIVLTACLVVFSGFIFLLLSLSWEMSVADIFSRRSLTIAVPLS
jgi:hypothetical protein